MAGAYNISGNELYDRDRPYNVPFIMPEDYGAVGDGVADDTDALQSAIDQKGLILFSAGATYKVAHVLRLYKDTKLDLNGSTILCNSGHLFFNFLQGATTSGYNGEGDITICNGTIIGGALSFIHAQNILIKNVKFRNSKNDHFLEICACKNYVIDGCSFIGMENLSTSVLEYINIDPCSYIPFPWNDNIASFYDGTVNNGVTIKNCEFSLGDTGYNYGYNAIGVHTSGGSKHQKIRILRNEISGFTGCGLRINNMNDVIIDDNIIKLTAQSANGINVGDIAQSTNVIIKGNVITVPGTAVSKANNSSIFQSSDNDINPTFS